MCRTLALISVVAAPDGKSIYVTTGRGQGVVIIDTATNKPVASIEVGGRPRGIAVSADGRTVFTANGPSNVRVDCRCRIAHRESKVTVGDRPWGIAFIP